MRSKIPQSDTEITPHVIIGARTIAKHFNCHMSTIYRWVRHLGFPAAPLPNGYLATTTTLIDQWLLARHIHKDSAKNGRPRKPRHDPGGDQAA